MVLFPVLCVPSVNNELLCSHIQHTKKTALSVNSELPSAKPMDILQSLSYLTSLWHLRQSIIPSFLKMSLPLVLLSQHLPITTPSP